SSSLVEIFPTTPTIPHILTLPVIKRKMPQSYVSGIIYPAYFKLRFHSSKSQLFQKHYSPRLIGSGSGDDETFSTGSCLSHPRLSTYQITLENCIRRQHLPQICKGRFAVYLVRTEVLYFIKLLTAIKPPHLCHTTAVKVVFII